MTLASKVASVALTESGKDEEPFVTYPPEELVLEQQGSLSGILDI